MTEQTKESDDKTLCACGKCGELIDRFNRWGYERKYKHGHNNTGTHVR